MQWILTFNNILQMHFFVLVYILMIHCLAINSLMFLLFTLPNFILFLFPFVLLAKFLLDYFLIFIVNLAYFRSIWFCFYKMVWPQYATVRIFQILPNFFSITFNVLFVYLKLPRTSINQSIIQLNQSIEDKKRIEMLL